MKRRYILTTILVAVAIACANSHEESEKRISLNTKINNSLSEFEELKGLDKEISNYLKQWEMKGASVAIMRKDSLIYAKGYGWADQERDVKMDAGHILRMASVSKLITAVGIMKLQDEGRLSLKSKVFGPEGILKDNDLNSLVKDTTFYKITIEHLLRHQGGFYRDPLFSSKDVKLQMRLTEPPVADDFFRLVLPRNLIFQPGSWQKYSNFGYLLLSRIIEHVSGKPYEQYIKDDVLAPAGCYDMHIAGNYYEDKRENEVRYYTHNGDGKFIEEYTGSGRMVERSYGGNNITLLSGAGGWCGSTIELARFVACIDGQNEIPDIISKKAVNQMIEYFDKDTFSLGWNDTAPEKGWIRTGTFSGTSAIIRYFPDGECWIFISNTSTWKGHRQTKYTDSLFRKCRKLYGDKFPARNLFE
jgi:CubicO group peptidase (beta-lactamase class C family)